MNHGSKPDTDSNSRRNLIKADTESLLQDKAGVVHKQHHRTLVTHWSWEKLSRAEHSKIIKKWGVLWYADLSYPLIYSEIVMLVSSMLTEGLYLSQVSR